MFCEITKSSKSRLKQLMSLFTQNTLKTPLLIVEFQIVHKGEVLNCLVLVRPTIWRSIFLIHICDWFLANGPLPILEQGCIRRLITPELIFQNKTFILSVLTTYITWLQKGRNVFPSLGHLSRQVESSPVRRERSTSRAEVPGTRLTLAQSQRVEVTLTGHPLKMAALNISKRLIQKRRGLVSPKSHIGTAMA